MATFNMPAWFNQRANAAAIGQLQQQAASAAKTQWPPISECECCGAPIAQDETFCAAHQQAAQAASTQDPQCFEMGGEACFGCGACSNTLKMPVAQPKKWRIEWVEIVTPDGSEYIDAHQQWQAVTVDMPFNCIAD